MPLKLREHATSIVKWLKPYKEVIAVVVALSGTISGAVAYAVTYFATRQHVESVDCALKGKIKLLAFDTSLEEADIAFRTRLAGILPKLPPSIDTHPLVAELEKDIDQLKDKRAAKVKSYVEEFKAQAAKCNPGVYLP